MFTKKIKKQCYFSSNNIKHIDYKDVELLKKFIDPYARIIPRKNTGTSAKNQRALALSIKHARFMGLIPFIGR